MFIQVNKNSETRINRNPTEELFYHADVTFSNHNDIFSDALPRGKCLLSIMRTFNWHPITV